jgi:hypothetical protein
MDNRVTPDERAAPVDGLRNPYQAMSHTKAQMADLIESDGKLLAIAEKTIKRAREVAESYVQGDDPEEGECAPEDRWRLYRDLDKVWTEYDAAKEAL